MIFTKTFATIINWIVDLPSHHREQGTPWGEKKQSERENEIINCWQRNMTMKIKK